jgi:hypothetical protein
MGIMKRIKELKNNKRTKRKNTGQKSLKLKDITVNKWLDNLTGTSLEIPCVSYCQLLQVIKMNTYENKTQSATS